MVRFGNGKFNQIFILLKDVLRKDVIHVFEAFLDRLLEAFLKLLKSRLQESRLGRQLSVGQIEPSPIVRCSQSQRVQQLGEVGEEIAASKSASQALKERNAIVI